MKYRYPIALAVAAILLLISCKTAEDFYQKGKKKNPVKIAELCSTDWPCIPAKADTVYRIETFIDSIPVQCPDSIQYNTDSIPVKVPVYIKVPVSRVREIRTITIRVRETSREYVADSKAREATARADKWQRKAENRNTAIIWLVAGLGLSIITNIIMIRR